jgi:hypothetical protein
MHAVRTKNPYIGDISADKARLTHFVILKKNFISSGRPSVPADMKPI